MKTTITRPRITRRARLIGLAAAALSVVALAPAGAGAAPVKADTSPWLQYQPPTPGVTPFLFGGFSSTKAKPVCERDRAVDVYRSTDLMDWDYVWHSEELSGPNPGLQINLKPGDLNHYYVLSVERKIAKNSKGKKVVCAPRMTEALYAN